MATPAPQCAVCRHGSAAREPGARASYALVLLTGQTRLRDMAQQASTDAFAEFVPGASAFCLACRRVTWLSREDDICAALVGFRHRWETRKRMQRVLCEQQ